MIAIKVLMMFAIVKEGVFAGGINGPGLLVNDSSLKDDSMIFLKLNAPMIDPVSQNYLMKDYGKILTLNISLLSEREKTKASMKHKMNKKISIKLINSTMMDDQTTGCSVRMEEGKVMRGSLKPIYDDEVFKITTAYGVFSQNQDDVFNSIYYGVISFSWSNEQCFATLEGREMCVKDFKTFYHIGGVCQRAEHHLNIVLAVVLFIIIFLNFVLARYIYLRMYYAPNGHVLVSSTREIINFEQSYNTKVTNRVYYDRDMERAEAASLRPHRKIIKINWRVLFTFIICFRALSPVDGTNSRIFSKTVVMDSQDTIILGNTSVISENSVTIYNLIEEYYTGAFSIVEDYNWFCHLSDCTVFGTCRSLGELGKYQTPHMQLINSSYSVTRTSCSEGTSGCFATVGCQIVKNIISVKQSDLHKVFSLSSGSDLINLTIYGDHKIAVSSSDFESKLSIDKLSMIQDSTGTSNWICPFDSGKFRPMAGSLGDFQLLTSKAFAMDPKIIDCRCVREVGCDCARAKPFMDSFKHFCTELPSHYEGFKIEYSEGRVIASKEANLRVSLISPEPFPEEESERKCAVIRSEIMGVRQSGFQTFLVLHLDRAVQGAHITVTTNCTDVQYTVQCMGGSHIISISDVKPCIPIGVKTIDKSIDEQYASAYQSDMKINGEPFSWNADDIKGWFSHPIVSILGFVGSSTTVILIILVVIVVCRR